MLQSTHRAAGFRVQQCPRDYGTWGLVKLFFNMGLFQLTQDKTLCLHLTCTTCLAWPSFPAQHLEFKLLKIKIIKKKSHDFYRLSPGSKDMPVFLLQVRFKLLSKSPVRVCAKHGNKRTTGFHSVTWETNG